MPPCPRCGAAFDRPTNFCGHCGADLRGLGGETDTLVGARFGQVIDGRYRILQKLGEGGMGSVFQVEHTRMGKICALKLLRADLLEGERGRALRERFRQEARIVSRLVHPNTIQVFDFGETGEGELYLAMEHLKGESLHEVRLAAGGRLPEARVARIAIQVLRSLAEAHEAGIIHRDVKPQNVMILDLRDRKDFVKVLDFGIAKILRSGDGAASTGAGEIVGTPNYISPEQARGQPLDARSDLYSLGAMIFELLTGRAPFEAETPLGVVTAHLTEPVPVPHELAPEAGVSAPMEALVARALAKDPADRFESADAMRAALEALLGDPRPVTGARAALPPEPTGEQTLLVRADFDRFARRLVVRRMLQAVVPLILLAGALGGAWAYFGMGAAPITREHEPNDDPNRANVLTPVAEPDLAAVRAAAKAGTLRAVTGHIGRRHSATMGDVDWYRLSVQHATTGYLQVTPIPNVDLVLSVLQPDAKGALSVVARSDAPGKGVGEVLPALGLTPGTWYVQVREVRARGPAGKPLPPTENVSDPYHLLAATYRAPAGLAKAPDDTPALAAPLDPATGAAGLPGGPGQEAFFKVAAPPSGRVEVSVTGVPGARLRLEVWDRAAVARRADGHGRPLATRTGEAGRGVSLWLHRAPAPLWIAVRTEAAAGAARATPYRVAVAAAR